MLLGGAFGLFSGVKDFSEYRIVMERKVFRWSGLM